MHVLQKQVDNSLDSTSSQDAKVPSLANFFFFFLILVTDRGNNIQLQHDT